MKRITKKTQKFISSICNSCHMTGANSSFFINRRASRRPDALNDTMVELKECGVVFAWMEKDGGLSIVWTQRGLEQIKKQGIVIPLTTTDTKAIADSYNVTQDSREAYIRFATRTAIATSPMTGEQLLELIRSKMDAPNAREVQDIVDEDAKNGMYTKVSNGWVTTYTKA